jgi:21S rRNA (uridine2791-2'-O)-methyltransferase
VLKPGGHFVCKFYQGAEDKELEIQLNKVFTKVVRDKPASSRKVRARLVLSMDEKDGC